MRAEGPPPVAAPVWIDRSEVLTSAATGMFYATVERGHSVAAGTVLGPGTFLHVAEEAGLMDELTDVVLRQALSVCGRWQAGGLRTRIAINIPSSCLERLDLPLQNLVRHVGPN